MGLEGVELVVATEEAFAIAIPDAVAERIDTPADLIDYVATQVPTAITPECLTQQLFYRLRRGFRLQLPASTKRFGPEALLASIVEKDQWPQTWLAVRAAVGDATWPEKVQLGGFWKDGPKNVRQLIWQLLASLPKPTATEVWTKERIEAEVRRIITEVLAKRDYKLSAKFNGDLGVR